MDAKQPTPPVQKTQAARFGSRPAFSNDSDVLLLDRLNAVYKHRQLVLTVFLLVMIGVVLRTYTITPLYRASARVLIETESAAAVAGFNSPATGSYTDDPEPYYQTQYRILTGRDLGARVARRLQLEKRPEFNGQGAQPTALAAVLRTMRRQALGPLRELTGGSEPADAPPEAVSEESLVRGFLSRVAVEPVRNSRLVDVAVVSADPAFAALAADTLVDEYVKQNLELRLTTSEKSLSWLAGEIEKQRNLVEASERALSEYREKQNALSLEDRQNIVVARLNQLNDAVTRAHTTRVQKETAYNQLKSLGPTVSPDTLSGILQNSYIQSLKSRLADLQREQLRLSERYGEKHPEILKNAASIEDAQRQLAAEISKAVEGIRNEFESALAEERTMAAALEAQKQEAMDLNRKGAGYTVLEREAQSNRQVYESLLQREKELQVTSNARGNNVRAMDRAEMPRAPFTPDTQRNLLLGALAGLVLAIGLVLGLDYLDDSIRTPEDVTRKLKLPFLGLVPAVKSSENALLTRQVPHEFGEAFRSLRTSLVFSSGGEGTRVILVTSAQPLEGKSTTACNLAAVLAYGGARVLLIDADMRRPGVHRTLGIQNETGLSHLLTGQATARQAISRLASPDFWVMTAGMTPPNPSELLASDRMKTLIATVKEGPFDWVIVDTPPVLAVTDAVILTPWVSGVVFVIGAEMTQRRLAERAIETLSSSRPHLLGAVLNRVDIVRNKYYYSRYYGYKYKRYYVETPAA
jgi:polysaccharide biosynthesis transport protein